MRVNRNKVVLGLQWGDEGKGKVIDLLAGETRWVVRCQGGANAGHTVVVGGRKTVLHLLPSGVLHEGARCVIGNGVVVDAKALSAELDDLAKGGYRPEGRLLISDRAHLVLPCHQAMDAAAERSKGDAKVGTTLRGIGPTYGDKMARTGMRAGALRDLAAFEQALATHLQRMNHQISALGGQAVDVPAAVAGLMPHLRRMAPFVTDTATLVQQAAEAGETILFEGAQGVMLDIDYGTYPFVTSSNTGVGGVITGSGVNHKHLGEVIGVVKAYTTRVGGGPFPVELTGAKGEEIRQRGSEFGATTGRPRRCGWLDLVVLRHACRLNGVDSIALTKLDILDPEAEIPVCVGYTVRGRRVDTVPAEVEDLAEAVPIYETLAGWRSPIAGINRFDALPAEAKAYVRFIEERLAVPVRWIGTGPGREETVVR